MTLHKKVLISIGLTIAGLIVVLYVVSQSIFMGSYADLEEQHAAQDIERVTRALTADIETLASIVYDWAPWDATYDFVDDVKDGNTEYAEENLVESVFVNLDVNLMLFSDASGQIVFSKAVDLQEWAEVPVPPSLSQHLADNAYLLDHADPESYKKGILLLPEGPMLVASRPILTSDYAGPINGTLLMGRYLDSVKIEELAELTQLSLAVHLFGDSQIPSDFETARAALSQEEPTFVQPRDEESIAGYALLEDVYGSAALIMGAEMPRDIYAHGQASNRNLILAVLAVGLVLTGLTLFLLEKLVLSRLSRLSRIVAGIGKSGDISTRVSMPGTDELSNLGQAINGMLAELESAQLELLKLKLGVERSNDAIFMTDTEGNISYVNPGFEETYGYSSLEAVGQTPRLLKSGTLPPEVYAEFWETLLSKKVVLGELVNKTKDDRLITIEGTANPILDAKGNLVGFLAIQRDITERKQVDESLRASEEYYRALTENSLDAIAVLAGDGTIRYESNSTERVLGYKPEELVGTDPFTRVHPDDSAEATKLFAQILADPTRIILTEIRYMHRDGAWRNMEAVAQNLLGDPAVEGIVVNFRDVTERKRMEKQVLLSGRLASVGQLAAGVAHELNNPLAAVQGYAQFLSMRQDLDESMKEDVETIYKEAQRASRITANLLSFARKHEVQKDLVSINKVVESGLELNAYRLKVNNIEIVTDLAPDIPETLADFHQLQQVFVNLITNAEHAMTEAHGKGKILVQTETSGETIRITFTDDGPGIEPEHLSSIFDPFFTTKEVGQGTGLGLSICYGIVEQHGGIIRAESKLGEGTTFVVEIPVVATDQALAGQLDSAQVEQP